MKYLYVHIFVYFCTSTQMVYRETGYPSLPAYITNVEVQKYDHNYYKYYPII